MDKLKIPHDALVFVGDGRKALFLRNEGDERFLNLKTEKVIEEENPPTHEQGSERPGHMSKQLSSALRTEFGRNPTTALDGKISHASSNRVATG